MNDQWITLVFNKTTKFNLNQLMLYGKEYSFQYIETTITNSRLKSELEQYID